ncbi:MAG: MFS transporter [Vulcanisaeta sp.]
MNTGSMNSSWTRMHTMIFVVFSLSALIEAYIYSIAYIASSWVTVPKPFVALLSVWPPLWLLLGAVVIGPLSDAIGRRASLYLSLSMYIIGAVGLILSSSYTLLLLFIAVLMLAVGGEYNTVMIASHEYFPSTVRSRVVYEVLNFANLGGVLAALLALVNASVFMQRLALGLTLIIIVPMMYFLRTRIPESPHWLRSRSRTMGNVDSTGALRMTRVKMPPLWLRIIIGGLIGWSFTAGFTLLVLTLGPYYFPSLTNWLILFFSLTAFISGIIVGAIADFISRRVMLLTSSLGTLITSLFVWLVMSIVGKPQLLFWFLYVLFSMFVNTYWLSEDTLKSEYWVTRRRGSYTAVVRVISLGGSIPIIFLSSYLPMSSYFIAIAVVFGVGFISSLVWYLVGTETGKGISIDAWDYEQ